MDAAACCSDDGQMKMNPKGDCSKLLYSPSGQISFGQFRLRIPRYRGAGTPLPLLLLRTTNAPCVVFTFVGAAAVSKTIAWSTGWLAGVRVHVRSRPERTASRRRRERRRHVDRKARSRAAASNGESRRDCPFGERLTVFGRSSGRGRKR